MDGESGTMSDDVPEVPLVPASAIGFLLYPHAVQLMLDNPPANDLGPPPQQAR
jgi:hypothetical protein